MDDPARFRFGPLERRGILIGLRAPQLIVLAGTAVACVALLSTASSTISVLGIAALVAAGVVIAFVPIKGRSIDEQTPLLVHWVIGRITGRDRFAASPGQIPGEKELFELRLPGIGDELSILTHHVPDTEHVMGVIRDRRAGTYTGVLAARGRAFALLDEADKSRRLTSWAAVLTGFARQGSPVSRVQWVERTMADPGDAAASYLKDNIAVPLDSPIARSYLEVVDAAGPVSQDHEVFVALQIDARSARRVVKSFGGGDVGSCEVLRRELTALSLSLANADVVVDGALTPRLLAASVRNAFDPGSRASLAKIATRDGDRRGASVHTAGPMTANTSWTHFQTEAAFHATYWIAEWPRVDVDADFLAPLLLRTEAIRTVSVTMEPVNALKAVRSMESARTSAAADEELRARAGFLTTSRRHREHESLADHERDLSDGHSLYRFAGFITVSAATPEQLDSACADVEEAAARSLLDVRRLDGQQDVAFTYTLPLCRGLR